MNEPFRAELEAAHARIASLEAELALRASNAHVIALRRERRLLQKRARRGFPALARKYNLVGVLVSLFFVFLSIPLGHLIQAQLLFWSFVMVVPSFGFAARLAGRARVIAREETNLRIAEIDEELGEESKDFARSEVRDPPSGENKEQLAPARADESA